MSDTNNTGRITYNESIPAEVLQTIQAAFDAQAWLLPGWCQDIFVQWSGEGDPDNNLSVYSDYAYRYARITVYPAWLSLRPLLQAEAVIHEMVHIGLAPFEAYAKDTLLEFFGDESPKFKAHVDKQITDRLEMVTQDLAYLIERKTRTP